MTPDSYEAYLERYEKSRRGSKRRRRGRKTPRQQRRLGRFLALACVVCLCVLLARGRIFVVHEIEIVGNSLRSDAEIAARSGVYLGMSVFNVNKDVISGNLSADSYVELLDVKVHMPDTVVIEVHERVPRAAVNCAGVILLVDSQGYILERMSSVPGGDIITVSGMTVTVSAQGKSVESGVYGQLGAMQGILTALEDMGVASEISELCVEDLNNIYLVSRSGVQVILGDAENVSEKLIWMQAVLEELKGKGWTRGVLDVSSGKNATYTRQQ